MGREKDTCEPFFSEADLDLHSAVKVCAEAGERKVRDGELRCELAPASRPVTESKLDLGSLKRIRIELMAHPRLTALTIAAIALVYFALGLDARELTLLESQDLSCAAELFRTYRLSADHSPLHFALLNLWLHSGVSSVAWLRLPSALCVAGAAALVFQVAQRASGTTAGAWAALLFTTNPEVVDQARSLRLYGFGLLLSALCLERAQAFAHGRGRETAWVGFLAAAVLAVQTHLFLWLWVAPLAVLVSRRAFVVLEGAERRRALIAAVVACVLAISQVVHGFVALGFTHERHAVYSGVSHQLGPFLVQVVRHLLLGQAEDSGTIPFGVLAVIAALPALGIAALAPKTRVHALLVVLPPFVAAFALSFASEVEARYLCFALPGLAALCGVALARMPRVLATTAALGVAALAVVVVAESYGAEPTDWPAAAERLEAMAGERDVVAVFPGYWAETFRFYTRRRELVPVTYPVDLERVLARGRRVLLVVNDGRVRADLDAYLAGFTKDHILFSTRVRRGFEVHEVRSRAPRALTPAHVPGTLLVTGVVGGGGYAWSAEPDAARAFAELGPLFAAADEVVVGYAPYEPPLTARLLVGCELGAALRPQLGVTKALRAAGVRTVAVSTEHGSLDAAAAVLQNAHLSVVPIAHEEVAREPLVYELGTERVALVALGSGAWAKGRETSMVGHWRAALRPTDALVVFVPAPARYDAWPSSDERARARSLIDAGADVVIGSGGYAAKPVERYGTGVIAYSLGALALPPTLDLAEREATGVALRVGFEAGRASQVDVISTTFDDRAVPHVGRADAVPVTPSTGFAAVLAAFSTAHARIARDGLASKPLAYRTSGLGAAAPSWIDSSVKAWIPWTSRGTSPDPFDGGFFESKSYAGVRGVRSLGVPRAAIELDAAPGAVLDLELPALLLSDRLDVEYALPDDRELSKYRSLLAENVSVSVEGGPALTDSVPFHSGWHRRTLDTHALAGTSRRITLRVSSPASHFPIAFSLGLGP